jgi:type IV pilus assembly protein PilF
MRSNQTGTRRVSLRAGRHAFKAQALCCMAWFIGGCTSAPKAPESGLQARGHIERAATHFEQGRVKAALEQSEFAVAADPSLVAGHEMLALAQASLGSDKLAEASFRRALQLDGRDAQVLHNFGWYLCLQRRFSEAETMFSRADALPRQRDKPQTLLSRGICLARAGDTVRAAEVLTSAYELDPANPVTAVNLSEVLYRRGEYERARFYARRVNSGEETANAQSMWLAMRIERRLGNLTSVQAMGQRLAARFPQSAEALAYRQGKFED